MNKLKSSNLLFYSFVLVFCLISVQVKSQNPLFSQVLVSDVGFSNGIGSANTSRNLAIDTDGNIYVAYASSLGIRVAKSTDRGESFLPSVSVNTNRKDPEIAVDEDGIVYVTWIDFPSIYLSRSLDQGETFSAPIYVGTGDGNSPHMDVFEDNVYIVDQLGEFVYVNNFKGIGGFEQKIMPKSDVYADVRIDKNGVIYVPSDDPTLYLSKSTNSGDSFQTVNLSSVGNIFFSSYALSDSPGGTFIFVGGVDTDGYRIDASTGVGTFIALGDNSLTVEGRTLYADNFGALVDGFQDASGNLIINVSYNQGLSFPVSIIVANGGSHNIDRNPLYDDVDVVYEQNGNVYMNVYDGLLRGIKIEESIQTLSLCANEEFDLPYVLSGNFDPNSEFVAYLSDEDGSFESKTLLGSIISNTNGVIKCKLPEFLTNSKNYRIQIQSLANFIQSNIIDIIIGEDIAAVKPDDMVSCALDTNKALFDLTNQDEVIRNGNLSAIVSYFESEENAELNLNPILKPTEYEVLNSTTIWVRLETGIESKCPSFNTTSFDLNIENITIDKTVYTIYQCSDTVNAIYDLTEKESLISTNSELDFSYYESQSDVDADLKIVDPTTYESNSLNSTILILVGSDKCAATATSLELETIIKASYNETPLPLEICDNDKDGYEKFNLIDVESDILNSLSAMDHDFLFYENLVEAELGTDKNIKDPSSFFNTQKDNQTIYARVSEVGNICFTVIPFEIVVNVSPISAVKPNDLTSCRNPNGMSFFDLSVQDNIIMNGQADTEISYYTSELDAINKNNKISNTTNYEAANTTIWARLETFGNTLAFLCPGFDVTNFELEPTTPSVTQPTGISLCSDTIKTVYDLTIRESEITTEQNSSFTYYETEEDLKDGLEIANPMDYESDSLIKSIVVLITDGNGCFAQTNLVLTTIIKAIYNTAPQALETCDLDNDGFEEFDLSEVETDVLNGLLPINNYSFRYYEDKSDAELFNDNDIKNVQGFTNSTNNRQTIYTAIQQENTECYQVVQFDIIVNKSPAPKLETTYSICLDNNDQVVTSLTSDFENPIPIDTGLNTSEYEFQWYTGVNTFAANQIAGATDYFYNPDRAGVYSVVVTNKITNCDKKVTTEVIGSYPPVSVTAEVVSLPFSKNNKISVSVEGKGEYEYKIDDGEWQLDTLFSRVSEGEHTIYVRDHLNCDVLSDVALIIGSPDFFTPNGDGINEFWKIENVGIPNSVFVYVYDRFGKLVSQIRPGSQGWNGEFEGNPMPTDEYWFLLEYNQLSDGVLRQVKGHFSLIR